MIPEPTQVTAIVANPNDTFVVCYREPLDEQTIEYIRERIREHTNFDSVLILDDVQAIAVLRRDEVLIEGNEVVNE